MCMSDSKMAIIGILRISMHLTEIPIIYNSKLFLNPLQLIVLYLKPLSGPRICLSKA